MSNMYGGAFGPAGTVGIVKLSRTPGIIPPNLSIQQLHHYGFPHAGLLPEVYQYRKKNLIHLFRGLKRIIAARVLNLPHFYGRLGLDIIREDGEVISLGLVSLRVVTTAGVNYIATRLFDGDTSIGAFDFHAFGTGGTAENVADTALVTELTTQYAGDVRPTGTPSNPTANVYQSVATLSPDAGGVIGITEHGLMTANAAGTLLDRSLFSVVNITSGADSLASTYQITIAAGG